MAATNVYAILFALLFNVISGNEYAKNTRRAVVVLDSDGNYLIHDVNETRPIKWVAEASFKNDVFNTGWASFEVTTNANYSDSIQAYAAGYVEGYFTRDMVKNHRTNQGVDNYCDNDPGFCTRLDSFMKRNWRFMDTNVKAQRNTDPFWHQVGLALEQLSGLDDVYFNLPPQGPRTDFNTFQNMLLNLFGDLMDLQYVLHKENATRLLGDGSCSGLIKVLPGNKDLYVAHDTWNSYQSMLRILKKYDFAFHTTLGGQEIIPGKSIAFSSYPGSLFSADDFYVISSGLTTLETTIDNTNPSLWKYVNPDKIIMEWIRSMVANRLAKTGKEWVDIFKKFNSGTYNNQWMVVDYKLFVKGQPLPSKDLLWILEQMPGYTEEADMTDFLRENTYWPSYNIPYFPDIFNMSGYGDQVQKYGDYFTYDRAPRALIFKRDQGTVKDFDSMIRLMRYNNYTTDPLSRCNCTPPENAVYAIASRADLNPPNGTYPFPSLGHRSGGATDMKLTTSALSRDLKFVAIGGPTYDPLPPFQWSKTDFVNTSHIGHPDLWNFDPIVTNWNL